MIEIEKEADKKLNPINAANRKIHRGSIPIHSNTYWLQGNWKAFQSQHQEPTAFQKSEARMK
jgi:hypothetical protein